MALWQATSGSVNRCHMKPLELINLPALMERTEGRPEMVIGLIDGPVASGCPGLAGERIRIISARVVTRAERKLYEEG